MQIANDVPPGGAAAKGDVGASRPDRIGQDEFVHAIVRLGLLRAEHERSEAATSLSGSFEKVMEECVGPYAVFDLEDEMSGTLKSRGVRAVLAKHREGLAKQYAKWSGVDQSLDGGGAGGITVTSPDCYLIVA